MARNLKSGVPFATPVFDGASEVEIMEMLKGILFWCNAASEAGITLKEIASVGTVGYQIGQDPQLKEMLMYMIKLSEMGIGPEH